MPTKFNFEIAFAHLILSWKHWKTQYLLYALSLEIKTTEISIYLNLNTYAFFKTISIFLYRITFFDLMKPMCVIIDWLSYPKKTYKRSLLRLIYWYSYFFYDVFDYWEVIRSWLPYGPWQHNRWFNFWLIIKYVSCPRNHLIRIIQLLDVNVFLR